jgi:hypothetical protein
MFSLNNRYSPSRYLVNTVLLIACALLWIVTTAGVGLNLSGILCANGQDLPAELQASASKELASAQSHKQDIGDGILLSESRVEFPPLTRDAIDRFFDSLRAGGQFVLPPLRQSQQVANNISGIWAGTRTEFESKIGVITLRFRPSDEARLARAESGKNLQALADSFDVELELKPREFVIRHQYAENKLTRLGMKVDMGTNKVNPVLTEFVKGFRDAGMYFAWPSITNDLAHRAWSLLICPRSPRLVQRKRSEDPQLELQQSPYQLREVSFSISSEVRARIPPTDRPERISILVVPSENLPQAEQNKDEVKSLSPNVLVPYRPATSFGFFKPSLVSGSIQEGLLARIETENPAGYIRRQYHSHVVYMSSLNEPSPVRVIIGDRRAARDEGECYVVSAQRSVWNEYDRVGGGGG